MVNYICTSIVRKLVELTESMFKSQYENKKVYARIVSLIAVSLMVLATSFLYFTMNGELVYNVLDTLLNWFNRQHEMKIFDDLSLLEFGLTFVASILMFIITTQIIIPYLNIATLRNNPDERNNFVKIINILLTIHAVIYILLSTFIIMIAALIFIFMKSFGESGEGYFDDYPFWMWLEEKDLKW